MDTEPDSPRMSFLEREAEDLLAQAFTWGVAKRKPDGLVHLIEPEITDTIQTTQPEIAKVLDQKH